VGEGRMAVPPAGGTYANDLPVGAGPAVW